MTFRFGRASFSEVFSKNKMAEFQENFDVSKLPKCKVELHVHLEGSIRVETLWDLAQKKGIHLMSTVDDLRDFCHVKKPSSLPRFLRPLRMYLQVIAGDAEAIERIAYEFCEDAAKEGLLYVEVRYNPHLMSSSYGEIVYSTRKVNLAGVVESVTQGLERGSADFGIKVRSILCSSRGNPGWSTHVVQLCIKYKHRGVVGMDIAGEDNGRFDNTSEVIETFKLAAESGIHRTVHAGEDGPAEQVKIALDQLLAERIGHGYRVVEDPSVYARCLESGIHFETCPYSSLLTGAVKDRSIKHPIVRFAEDGANFSINRDDPTLTQKTLDEDYELLRGMGLQDVHFIRANFNAAHSAFLPEKEKKDLLQELRRIYGIDQD